MSVTGGTLGGVEVTAELVAKVPVENMRVRLVEFGVLWARAEELGSRPARGDQYLIGVVLTCRWLAGQPVPSPLPSRRFEVPRAPLTRRLNMAMPETIDEEYMAAVTARPFERERARGVAATLEWTWHGSRRPPLDISTATTN